MSGLEAVALAASVLGIIDVTTKVIAAAASYVVAVNNNGNTIKQLQTALQSMKSTLSHIQELIDETNDKSDKSLRGILQGHGTDIGEIERCRESLRELEILFEKYIPGGKVGMPSRFKRKIRQWSRPITDTEIQKLTLKLGAHCEKLTLNIGVDSNRKIRQVQSQVAVGLGLGEDSNRKVTEIQGQLTAGVKIGEDSNRKVTEIQAQVQFREQHTNLSKLPCAEGAAYNHYFWQHEDCCLPDTRVQLRQQIVEWYEDPNSPCIFWLKGMAGTGKSTIARTVAQELGRKKRLAASFFFSRGRGDISHAGKFFTTMAVQLAHSLPELKPLISQAIEDNFDIAKRGLREQWQHLICDPLKHATVQPIQLVVVIDALDECEDKNDTQLILQLLADVKSLTIGLRVFVTSRLETPILLGFRKLPGGTHQDFVLHDIPPSSVNRDISVFFQRKLSIVKAEYGLGTPWPDEHTIQLLVERAAGLFIYAATTYRFIQDDKYHPEDQLSLILTDDISVQSSSSTKHLDGMYMKLLEHSVIGHEQRSPREKEQLLVRFKRIVGSIVILFDVMAVTDLAMLLDLRTREVTMALAPLHSVLNIPEIESQPVRIFHPSFRDFLLDRQRCSHDELTFWIDQRERHIALFWHCIELMSKNLRQDMCGLEEPGVLVRDISKDQIQGAIPTELRYACHYWVYHLQQGNSVAEDNERILQFLSQHLLHWLEVLSLIGSLSEGVHMIATLENILKGQSSELLALAYDTRRFIRSHRSMLEKAPLQVYYAALLFSPESSLVRKHYYSDTPFIHRGQMVSQEWSPLIQTFDGHSSSISGIVFSPDGKLIASGSYDNTVRLWDTTTGESFGVLKGHSNWVSEVAFSPDGKLVASASVDNTVMLWDTSTGESFAVLKDHLDSVTAVAFSLDGKLIASASVDKTVRLWDTKTGESCRVLEGHLGRLNAVVFSPDSTGKLVASASDDKTVRLWDTLTGELYTILKGHSSWVQRVVFSPDGKLVASSSYDKTIRLWDTVTGELRSVLEGHSGSPRAQVAFSPDGNMVASPSTNMAVTLWDTTTGESYCVFEGRHLCEFNGVTISPDGKLFASASNDRAIRLWNISTKKLCGVLKGHSGWASAVVFSPDGKFVASASDDMTVRLWDTSTVESCEAQLNSHSDMIFLIVFSPDGTVVASASRDETVRLWNALTGESYGLLESDLGMPQTIVFSPDGELVAVASEEKTVRLWHTSTRESYGVLQGHSADITAVAFSSDGKRIASASNDMTVRLWDTSTKELCKILSHPSIINAVMFSPDGKLVASASLDEKVRLWDTITGESCGVLMGHKEGLTAVVFSPDGKLLASASHTVNLWDIDQMKIIDTIAFDGHEVWHLAFSERSQLQINQTMQPSAFGLFPKISTVATFPSSLCVNDEWVTWDSEPILFLPVDLRPQICAVKNNILVMGFDSGDMIFLYFDPASLSL